MHVVKYKHEIDKRLLGLLMQKIMSLLQTLATIYPKLRNCPRRQRLLGCFASKDPASVHVVKYKHEIGKR